MGWLTCVEVFCIQTLKIHDGCIHFALMKGLFRAGIPKSSLFSLAMPIFEYESAS